MGAPRALPLAEALVLVGLLVEVPPLLGTPLAGVLPVVGGLPRVVVQEKVLGILLRQRIKKPHLLHNLLKQSNWPVILWQQLQNSRNST